MKMKKVMISVVIIITILLMSTQIAYAIDTSITSDNFANQFNPSNKVQGVSASIANPIVNFMINIANPILGVVQVIGGILTIVSIAVYGFKSIVSTDSDIAHDLFGKAMPAKDSPEYKISTIRFLKGLLIGSFLLFTSATIVRAVMKVIMT